MSPSRRAFLATGALAIAGGTSLLRAPGARAATAPLTYEPTLPSLAEHALPAWWQDAKFGVFVHWGAYSVPAWGPTDWPLTQASEWYWLVQQLPLTPYWWHHLQTYGPGVTYDDFIARFGAERYDPDGWARLIAAAGAKYFVLTTKHHDGLALFPSAVSNRTSAVLGPKRDLVGPLVTAARGRGLKVGLYYSVPEWFNPAPHAGATLGRIGDALGGAAGLDLAALEAGLLNTVAFNELPARNAYTQLPVAHTGYQRVGDYGAFERAQLREIINGYRPDLLWADIGGPECYFHGNQVIADFYSQAEIHNPGGVIVNDRFGDQHTHHDYVTVENGGTYQNGSYTGVPAETVRTMGVSWGYKANDVLAPAETFIHELVVAVANNSNYVLNVGPRADGTIPQPMADRLQAIGTWLEINGEAIYRTRPWTQPSAGAVYFTSRPSQALYLITLSWPGRQLIVNAPVPLSTRTRITLLGGDGTPLLWQSGDAGLAITLPANGDQKAATRSEHAFAFRITPA